MGRTARASVGGMCYHVLNRGNGRLEGVQKGTQLFVLPKASGAQTMTVAQFFAWTLGLRVAKMGPLAIRSCLQFARANAQPQSLYY